jgi:hypothetical protein
MSEKRPENAIREKLEAMRARLFLRYGEKGLKRLTVLIPTAFFALLALILFFFLFPIRGIEVVGDATVFNEGDIIQAAEIEEGDSFFLRSSGSIKRALERNLPLAEKIKVTKTFTGKIKIDVEFRKAEFFAKCGELFFAFDSDLTVVGIDSSRSKFLAFGAVYVRLPEVRDPEVGKKIVFYDTIEETDTAGELLYEVKEEKYYDYVPTYLKALLASGFHEDADVADLRRKFDIVLIYAEKFEAKFGYVDDLEAKFNVFFKILEEGSAQSYDKATADLTNPSKATLRPNNLIDIDEYMK